MSKILSKNPSHAPVKIKAKSTAKRLSTLIAIVLVSIFASNLLQNVDSTISTQNRVINSKITQK